MEPIKEVEREIKGKALGYISAALGLVAGLAWNDAIVGLIDFLFPLTRNTVLVKFVYAIILTIVVVMLIKSINRIFNNSSKSAVE